MKRNVTSDDRISIFVHNKRSLPRHVDDIVSNNRVINKDIIRSTETQSKPSDSTYKTIEMFNLFNIDFNNNETKFSSLAYGCKNDVALLDKFDANGVSREMLLLTEYEL